MSGRRHRTLLGGPVLCGLILLTAITGVSGQEFQLRLGPAGESPAPSSDAPLPDPGPRSWTDTQDRQLFGELIAFDRVRATIRLDDGRVVFLRPQTLSPSDQTYLDEWRAGYPRSPWIDPLHLPPWPTTAGVGPVKAVLVKAEGDQARFTYQSANFELVADVSLPLDAVSEMATAFEATRAALLSLPLGLGAAPVWPKDSIVVYRGVTYARIPGRGHVIVESDDQPRRHRVELFISPQAYALAGGPTNTGGHYSTQRRTTLISLENIGIGSEGGRLTLDYRDNLFILRHEICHQIMHSWLPLLPTWLNEGLAEYLAAVPYEHGRYRFENVRQAFLAYLNKWRYEEDPRRIPMRAPDDLFELGNRQWMAAISLESPVLNYNSAALLAWQFLHEDGGRHFAAYLDAVRLKPHEADRGFELHLVRQRTPEHLAAAIRAEWQPHGVEIVVE